VVGRSLELLELLGLLGLRASVVVVGADTTVLRIPSVVFLIQSSLVLEDLTKVEWIRTRYGYV
jgi:hypothetical protein